MKLLRSLISLTRDQIRSLYSVAMLAGIVALSAESWVLLWLAEDADGAWFKLIVERLRYVTLLTGMFALIVALTVFGADYFRARWGNKEAEFGERKE